MRSKGFIQKGSAFAGHSLDEYSAPASIADVLECDFQNRSNYAMCSVNPFCVSQTLNNAALRMIST